MSKLTTFGLLGGLGVLGVIAAASGSPASAAPASALPQASSGSEITLVQARRSSREARIRARNRIARSEAAVVAPPLAAAPFAFGVPAYGAYSMDAVPPSYALRDCVDDLGYGRFTPCTGGGL